MAEHHAERMIAANGIEICADSFGEPGDPAVLLVMGGGASMLLWDEQFCEQLADGGRFVIRYDNRDTGRTTCCPPGEPNYTLDDMAADGVAVLDAYGVEQAHIVGASMGGIITQAIGLNHPERVLTLTPIMSTPNTGILYGYLGLVETDGDDAGEALSPPTPEVIEAVAAGAALDWNDREAVLANRIQMFRTLAGSKYPYEEWRDEVFAAEIDRAVNMQSSLNHGPAIAASPPWHERLDQLSVPTLVIHGTDDPILPYDHGQALAAAIPGATLLALEGVGHELPTGVLDVVIPALLEHTG